MNNITKLDVDIYSEAIRQYVQSNIKNIQKHTKNPGDDRGVFIRSKRQQQNRMACAYYGKGRHSKLLVILAKASDQN